MRKLLHIIFIKNVRLLALKKQKPLQMIFLFISSFAIIEEIPSKVEGLKEEEGTNQKKKKLGSTVLGSE